MVSGCMFVASFLYLGDIGDFTETGRTGKLKKEIFAVTDQSDGMEDDNGSGG